MLQLLSYFTRALSYVCLLSVMMVRPRPVAVHLTKAAH
jgi:hypothetical protein